MRKMLVSLVLCAAGVGLPRADGGDTDLACRFEPLGAAEPSPEMPVIGLPRLPAAPTVDGRLAADEWRGATVIPRLTALDTGAAEEQPTEFLLGLDLTNLYIGVRCGLPRGAEPLCRTLLHDGLVWQDDSVEVFVTPSDGKAWYGQFIVNSQGARYDQKCSFPPYAAAGRGDLQWNPPWEAKTGREEDAWTLEMAIPWTTLEMEPRGVKGIRLNLGRNHIPGTPAVATWAAKAFHAPARFGVGLCRFDGAPASLGLNLAGFQKMQALTAPLAATNVSAWSLQLALPKHPELGPVNFKLKAEFLPLDFAAAAAPPTPVFLGEIAATSPVAQRIEFQGVGRRDGVLRLRAESAVGQATFSALVLNATLPALLERFRPIAMPEIAALDPFKAAAYAGAAACVERLKRKAELFVEAPPPDLGSNVREAKARLDLLERGQLVPSPAGLLDLLNLAAIPEAQVVVDYSDERSGAVGFLWAGIPLACVEVRDHADEAQARAAAAAAWTAPTILSEPSAVKIEGQDAWTKARRIATESMLPELFDPGSQVLLFDPATSRGLVFEAQSLSQIAVTTAVVLANCPDATRRDVESWLLEADRRAVPLQAALGGGPFVLAGDFRKESSLRVGSMACAVPRQSGYELVAVKGRRTLTIRSMPSREGAELAAGLVLRGRPVSPADVNMLRKIVVRDAAPPLTATPWPRGRRFFCGDVHSHTFFSDGEHSPVGLALNSIYWGLDFLVISDHSSIAGAQLAQRLLADHGVRHKVIAGEELTARQIHCNAYPVKEIIDASRPLEEWIAAAHRQGAVIQWNHPGYPSSLPELKRRMDLGAAGAGCDAWEHFTWRYEGWKQQNRLPVLVGSTDTHDGTFSFPERTGVWSPAWYPMGLDLAQSILSRQTVLISEEDRELFYGPDPLVTWTWTALVDGEKLKALKASRLRTALEKADLPRLLASSPAHP